MIEEEHRTIEVEDSGAAAHACAHHWIVIEEEIQNYPHEPCGSGRAALPRVSRDAPIAGPGATARATAAPFHGEPDRAPDRDVEMDLENTPDTEPYCESCSHYDCIQDRGRDYWRRLTIRK